jgi:hypothetical protein
MVLLSVDVGGDERVLYIDNSTRAGIGSYVCDPVGLWYDITDAWTSAAEEEAVNVDECHWELRRSDRRYKPCVARCAH